MVPIMYTIGEFAALGRVSVRMLRHYDAIGLLRPARVDVHSGYRYYGNDQLRQLLRIVELRDLGCSLDDAAAVLHSSNEDEALRELLVRRRVDLAASLEADIARLAHIDERLRSLEGITVSNIEYRAVPPVVVYAVRGRAAGAGPENVAPIVEPLIGRLVDALEAAGREVTAPSIVWYESVEGSEELEVSVSFVADAAAAPGEGFEVVELPALSEAAVLTHRGEMAGIGRSWAALMEGVVAEGREIAGPAREVYVRAGADIPQSEWVTELQVPLAPA